ncbi:pro-sigmaK processing inhibitor BofA family protein [Salibacterium qingdaonense]|uniref:Inhibitor of the pro-sigma K processing machinery n=1 Tax=Salibacterium qingdaonense TaxID=266892 RepID=A0A1I4R143_9BACI|nr:pro-sigmaK processing inhibitor BofA family protein [Salibacterium qingdaonense]SFM45670.1 inhibitor of the pro-sigma K processing machinery [Salibacterium qingdaonense]
MNPILYISLAGVAACLFFMFGKGGRSMRWTGNLLVKLILGALALFFLNAFGTAVGYHLPINTVTVSVSGLLGIPGILMLIAIDIFIIG